MKPSKTKISPHDVNRIMMWANLVRRMPDKKWCKTDERLIEKLIRIEKNLYNETYKKYDR